MLWDLDGTLVDSRDQHWRAWRDTLAGEGVTFTEADFQETFGLRNDAIVKRWLGPEITPDQGNRVAAAKERRFRTLVEEEGISPLPGVEAWIPTLDAAGWKQAIASSAPSENVAAVLRALPFLDVLEAAVTAEDVRRGKPDPEVFLTASQRLGVAPERCVVVEDVAAGIEGAKRAGMATIGVGGVGDATLSVATPEDLTPDAFDALVPLWV